MKKVCLLLLSVLSLPLVGCNSEMPSAQLNESGSENVLKSMSVDKARTDMFDILAAIGSGRSRGKEKVVSSEYLIRFVSRARSVASGECFYVFNFENNEGYAIMTTNTEPSALVALADTGSLVPNVPIDNPGLVMFLSKVDDNGETKNGKIYTGGWVGWYQDPTRIPIDPNGIARHEVFQWDPTISKNSPSGPNTPTSGETEEKYTIKYTDYEVISDVPSLCKTKWGQDSPYNITLDAISEGIRPRTGSLATALGQMMCAYQHPQTIYGDTIPWAKLRNRVLFNKENRIRANVLKMLGFPENLDMNYGQDYSFANPENVIRTLSALGYSNSGVLSEYNCEDVLSEVKNGYISIIGGSASENYERMHYWLVDGCEEVTCLAKAYNSKNELVDTMRMVSRYLRCNWGCNGEHNGIYSLSGFDASFEPPKHIDDVITITPIDSPDVNKPVIMSTRRRSTDPDLQNYKYNLQAITGIRK